MPRGQKKGWKEKQGLVPGARVPGDENRGILFTNTSRFAVYYNYANRRCYAGTYDDLPLAREARDRAIAARRSGRSLQSAKSGRMLFSAFVEGPFFTESFLLTKKGGAKKESTIRAAKSRYAVYLKPCFGDTMLEDITSGKIRAFRARLDAGEFAAAEIVELPPRTVDGKPRRYKPRRTDALSSKSKREILLLLRQIINAAREDERIKDAPFPDRVIPSADPAEMTPPDLATALAIAKAIPSVPHRTLTYVLIYTGCRLGEAMALTWDDIDFAGKRIRIARSADAKTRKIQEPKSKRAKRSIPLDPRLAKALRAYRTRQEKGIAPALGSWLFPTTRPNDAEGIFVMDQRSYVQRHFDPACRSVTAKHVSPHMLRHTWCSVAVTKYPVAYVSKWAGHSDVSFTYRTYVQALGSEEARFAASFSLQPAK
jgi:integrase